MRINRTLALTLVSAIAAGSSAGCTIVQKSDDGSGGASDSKGGGSAKGGAGGEAGSTLQGGAAGDASQGGAAGNATQGGSSGSSTTATCLTGAGTTVDCTTLAPDASCSPFSFPADACTAGQGNLKPAVGESFGKCVTALSATDLCDATFTYECLYKALKSACEDAAAATACEAIRTTCTEVTQTECQEYANGLNATGLDSYSTCMTESAYCMPQSCAEGLSW